MENKPSTAAIVSMAFVVTGNMLGAGILGLPIKTGLSGFWPSVAGILLMWVLMLSSAFILASQKSLTQSATADLPTFFQEQLGTAGKWVTVAANAVILYGLLTAYLSGAASVMKSLFSKDMPDFVPMLIFFCVATFLTLFGMALMRKGNAVIMVAMWITFGVLVYYAAEHMHVKHLDYTDWAYLPISLPIVVTAFHFHNIIPSICRGLNFHQPSIRKAMFLGTFIGLIMNLVWVLTVIAALPLNQESDSLLHAFQENWPATVPLSELMSSNTFMICGLVFALLAMCAAYMANGTALTSFIRDLCSTYLHTSNPTLARILAFVPPLAIAVLYPELFLVALDIVGGVGIDIIFGILPGVLLIKYKKGWLWAYGVFMVACFAIVLGYELGQEFHLLNIHPKAEYWHIAHPVR